ncbi:hypothetical protein [Zooshikella harenae]|uniref:O-antigen ligase domain-containing protein n=1 Tax=Zooshikella harenae TaxID=2827238 RepID=A0ABS5Z8J4_9GAMM|nr:hypothetical protein [Zooshikella harenae]MBU2710377.1 hypothetical protein [Zooshikella harenae]
MITKLFVAASIILSGSLIPFIFSDGYGLWLLCFLFTLLLIAYQKKSKITLIGAFSYLILVSFLLLFPLLQLDFESLGETFGIIVRLSIALLFCSIIPFSRFVTAYAQFFYIYAFISLIFYIYGLIYEHFIYLLPVSHNDAGTGYRHLFLYFYQGVDYWNYRNSGLFWEAGAYAVFLCFALLFSLANEFNKYKVIVIVLAIITTGSTTGILSCSLMILFARKIKLSRKIVGVVVIVLISLPLLDVAESIFISKFSEENISFVDRSVGIMANLSIFLSSPIFGVGLSNYKESFQETAVLLGAYTPTSSDSFTGLLALYGFFYTIAVFFSIFYALIKLSKKILNPLVAFLSIAILYASQGLVNFPISYILLFYGLQLVYLSFKLNSVRLSQVNYR